MYNKEKDGYRLFYIPHIVTRENNEDATHFPAINRPRAGVGGKKKRAKTRFGTYEI